MVDYLEIGLKSVVEPEHLAGLLAAQEPNASEQELQSLSQTISQLLGTIPANIRLINAYIEHPLCRKPLGFAFGEVLRYCFDEKDLLPEQTFGALGLIDDAYLLQALSNLLPLYFPYAVPTKVEAVPFESRSVIENLLPEGVVTALDRTAHSILDVAVAMFGSGGQEGGNDGDGVRLRIGSLV